MRPLIVITDHVIKRFNSYIQIKGEDECWPWRGASQKYNYGSFSIGRNQFPAHIVAFAIHNKCDPIGYVIRHSCDNPRCCNPKHLLDGTTQDNVDDRVNRKRSKGNEEQEIMAIYDSCLTEQDIKEIRWLFNFITAKEISNIPKFKGKIKWRSIYDIIDYKTWKDV